jgi:putative intracellular protease/amidase
VGLTPVVPFALETRLRELGGRYERGPMWSSFAVRDGRLVTGQNPQSSEAVAREVLDVLSAAAF